MKLVLTVENFFADERESLVSIFKEFVMPVENFFADERESLVSIFKEFVMPDEGLHIFPSNIQLLHQIIWLLSLLLYMVV